MGSNDKHFGVTGTGELRPGATPRRYEPNCGIKKHNERIHKESKNFDVNSNLPFTFRKPQKAISRNTVLVCDNCGAYISGTKATVSIICGSCNKFSSVSEVSYDDT